MSASEVQMALSNRLLPTANMTEPLTAKKEIPTRFVQNFTHSSITNEEKGPLLDKQALKSSSAEKWLDAMEEEVQNLTENQIWFSVKAPHDKKIIFEKGYSKSKDINTELRRSTRPALQSKDLRTSKV